MGNSISKWNSMFVCLFPQCNIVFKRDGDGDGDGDEDGDGDDDGDGEG